MNIVRTCRYRFQNVFRCSRLYKALRADSFIFLSLKVYKTRIPIKRNLKIPSSVLKYLQFQEIGYFSFINSRPWIFILRHYYIISCLFFVRLYLNYDHWPVNSGRKKYFSLRSFFILCGNNFLRFKIRKNEKLIYNKYVAWASLPSNNLTNNLWMEEKYYYFLLL